METSQSKKTNISQVMVNYGQEINLNEKFSELCKLNQDIDELIRNDIVLDQKEDVFEITTSSQEFLKDRRSIEGKDNILESENIIEQFTNQIGNINLKENLERLQLIYEEEECVMEQINEMASEEQNPNKVRDYMEALVFEYSMRLQEKRKEVDKIMNRNEEISRKMKSLESTLKKTQSQVKVLQHYQDNKNMRHHGKFENRNNHSLDANQSNSSMYDWVMDIDLITEVQRDGWKLYFRKEFVEQMKGSIEALVAKSNGKALSGASLELSKIDTKYDDSWDGAIVAVVGLYDKGKTFVLNNLTQSTLPSGKKLNTKGLSFKHVDVDSGTKLVLLDTAGSYSPVKVNNDLSVIEKEATELFLLDLVFDLSDYFVCVVNDFTSLDQRYLDKLSRNLQNSPAKTFREIIVVHNLKDVESQEILDHLWESQVTHIYGSGSIQRTKVAALNPFNNELQEKHVIWFKTAYSRHVCLANDDSVLGHHLNPWTFSLLRYWLKAVFVPVNRKFSVVENVLDITKNKLSSYFKTASDLILEDTDQELIKVIKTKQSLNDNKHMKLPQVAIDTSGFITSRPDGFFPQVDIIKSDHYCIYMEVPGMTKEEITIYRENVVTVVKGNKKTPVQNTTAQEKNERKYGEFTMTFKIPENYERRWSEFSVNDGVLIIKYPKDIDDAASHIDDENKISTPNDLSKSEDYDTDNFQKNWGYNN